MSATFESKTVQAFHRDLLNAKASAPPLQSLQGLNFPPNRTLDPFEPTEASSPIVVLPKDHRSSSPLNLRLSLSSDMLAEESYRLAMDKSTHDEADVLKQKPAVQDDKMSHVQAISKDMPAKDASPNIHNNIPNDESSSNVPDVCDEMSYTDDTCEEDLSGSTPGSRKRKDYPDDFTTPACCAKGICPRHQRTHSLAKRLALCLPSQKLSEQEFALYKHSQDSYRQLSRQDFGISNSIGYRSATLSKRESALNSFAEDNSPKLSKREGKKDEDFQKLFNSTPVLYIDSSDEEVSFRADYCSPGEIVPPVFKKRNISAELAEFEDDDSEDEEEIPSMQGHEMLGFYSDEEEDDEEEEGRSKAELTKGMEAKEELTKGMEAKEELTKGMEAKEELTKHEELINEDVIVALTKEELSNRMEATEELTKKEELMKEDVTKELTKEELFEMLEVAKEDIDNGLTEEELVKVDVNNKFTQKEATTELTKEDANTVLTKEELTKEQVDTELTIVDETTGSTKLMNGPALSKEKVNQAVDVEPTDSKA